MAKKLSKRAIAAALNVSPQSFVRYMARGCPSDSVEAALAWQALNVDPLQRELVAAKKLAGAAAAAAAANPDSTVGLRYRQLLANTRMIERNDRIASGEFVSIAKVERAISEYKAPIVSALDRSVQEFAAAAAARGVDPPLAYDDAEKVVRELRQKLSELFDRPKVNVPAVIASVAEIAAAAGEADDDDGDGARPVH